MGIQISCSIYYGMWGIILFILVIRGFINDGLKNPTYKLNYINNVKISNLNIKTVGGRSL